MAAAADPNQKCVALYDYTGATDEELSFAQGDVFVVISSDTPDWWLVQSEKDASIEGYVPSTYVRLVDVQRESVSQVENSSEQQSPAEAYASDEEEEEDDEDYSEESGYEDEDEEYDDDDDDEDEDESEEEGDKIREILRKQAQERRKAHAEMNRHRRKLIVPDPQKEGSDMNLPRGFRLSTLSKNYQAGHGHLQDILAPAIDSTGLAYSELKLDRKNRLRKVGAKCTVAFSLLDARNVPSYSLSQLEVRGRHIRLAIFDKTSILSNIHAVPAVSADHDRTWRFSTKASLLFPRDDENTCFLRVNDIDIRLCLLFELCAMVAMPTGSDNLVEISCGWGLLPLFTSEGGPIENKSYEIRLFGGTPFEKDVDFEEPPVKRGLLGKSTQFKPPCIHVRVWKLGKDALDQLDNLPSVILGHLSAGPVLSMFRQTQARALVQTGTHGSGPEMIYEPVLGLFPRIAEELDMLQLLVALWDRKQRKFKRSEKNSPGKMIRYFRIAVISMWPLFSFWDMPKYHPGNDAVLKERASFVRRLQEFGMVDLLGRNAGNVTFKPFDLSELTMIEQAA